MKLIWNRYEDEDESRFSPIDARRAIALLPRLPRSSGVAGALDGRGKGSSCQAEDSSNTSCPSSFTSPSPGLSKRTIQNHVDNMWLLGGEIIRDVNQEPSLRKVAAEQLVRNVVHEDGGPLIHNGWEDEQRSFDSTCRKFHRFLTQPQL